MGADDKAVGSCAEVVKREASDECESAAVGRVQDFDVAGGNDSSGFDKILKITRGRLERDCVAQPNIAQRAEKSVAVSGESNVAGFSGQGRFRDMADRAAQNRV